jgi:hypothetical protein
VCDSTHTDVLSLAGNLRLETPEEMEGHMRRPITIAIAITVMSLFALLFWQAGMNVTEEDAAVASARLEPGGYALPRLEPVW